MYLTHVLDNYDLFKCHIIISVNILVLIYDATINVNNLFVFKGKLSKK